MDVTARRWSATGRSAASGPEPHDLSIFQKDWWLDAVSDGAWTKVETGRSSGLHAWLPIYAYRRAGCPMIGMPPLTSVLGPVVTQPPEAMQRRQLLTELISNIPRYTRFTQVFPANAEDAYVFALQGFAVSNQYTEILEPAEDEPAAWKRLNGKTRNIVRKGATLFDVNADLPIEVLYEFLDRNLVARGKHNKLTRDVFLRAAQAAQAAHSIACLGATTPSGRLAAGIVVIWDARRLYYLLSTRDPQVASNAAITLLLWEAIRLATRKRLVLDFDSYGSSGAAAFIGSFGGKVEARCVISGASRLGAVLTSAQQFWRAVRPGSVA